MKHMVILIVMAYATYALWRIATSESRAAAGRFMRRHVPFVMLSIAIAAVLIGVAASSPSFKFL